MTDPTITSDYWNTRLADGGPLYVETNLARAIVEPCNAVTAALFIGIVAYWFWRMRGRYREHLFTCLGMPILLAGGIGGTLFHGLREHEVFWIQRAFPKIFFLMDVIPIGLLVVLGSCYLWVRLRPRWWHFALLAAIVAVFPLLFVFHVETHVAIVVHYIALALLVLVPVAIVLVRTRFRYLNLIKLTVVCFGFAILFRFLDPLSAPILPGLGTHWLWHVGGAITTTVLAEYFYRLETEPIAPLAWQLKTDLPT